MIHVRTYGYLSNASRAVSYTHLFQAYLKKIRELAEGPLEEIQKEVEVTNKFPQEFYDLATVSYTHLDVYKRQGVGRGEIPIEPGDSWFSSK